MGFISRLQNAIHWYKCQDKFDKKDYRGSLLDINKMNRTSAFAKEIDMFKAQIYFNLHDVDAAVTAAREALVSIRNDSRLSKADRSYCMAYANWVIANNEPEVLNKEQLIAVPLQSVDRKLIENFPLRVHPDWTMVND